MINKVPFSVGLPRAQPPKKPGSKFEITRDSGLTDIQIRKILDGNHSVFFRTQISSYFTNNVKGDRKLNITDGIKFYDSIKNYCRKKGIDISNKTEALSILEYAKAKSS